MKSMKVDMKKYSLILILIGMMIVCSLLNSSFMSGTNLMNILKQVSIVTICSFAQGMIIITGDIDLSIGYLAGMAGTFACIVFVATQNLFLAFMVGVLIGAVVGAINGLLLSLPLPCKQCASELYAATQAVRTSTRSATSRRWARARWQD